MTPEDEVARATRAAKILEDPFVQEALDVLERAAINKLKLTPDDQTRLRLVDFLQAAELFKQYFTEHINTGKLANATLLERENALTRLKRKVFNG